MVLPGCGIEAVAIGSGPESDEFKIALPRVSGQRAKTGAAPCPDLLLASCKSIQRWCSATLESTMVGNFSTMGGNAASTVVVVDVAGGRVVGLVSGSDSVKDNDGGGSSLMATIVGLKRPCGGGEIRLGWVDAFVGMAREDT